MTTQHTPGPWFIWKELAMQREGIGKDEIDDELLYSSEHGIYAGNPSECTRGSLRGHTAHICDIETDNLDFDDDEDLCKATDLANARLIAAAPDLLAAAKAALQVFVNQGWEDDLNAAKDLKRAIAKAEGGAA